MGKKAPPKGELEGSPRKAKSPRLDPLALSIAPPAPEASDPMEVDAEAVGTSGDNRCNHVLTDIDLEKLCSSLLSKKAGTCAGCRHEDATGPRKNRPEESDILMCVECGRHLCCGVGAVGYPFGHSRAHAMKKKHWVAVLYDDAEKGYCFNCNAEVEISDAQDRLRARMILLRTHPQFLGVMGVNPDVVEMTGKLQAEGHASGFGVIPSPAFGLSDPRDKRHSHELGSAIMQDYAIRGIPNTTNTCYANAILQCFLALDKLRERLLAPGDRGLCASALTELFEETSAARGLLDPQKILTCVSLLNDDFGGGRMQDSQEFLSCLRDCLHMEEIEIKKLESQIGAPTFINSIFGFELSQRLSCKCGSNSVKHTFFNELSLPLPLPSKRHPTKSVSSPQTSQSLKSQKNAVQLFPANEQSNFERMQTVAQSDDSHLLDSELKEVIVEATPLPLEVDSTEAQCICQNKYVVQDPLQTEKNKISSFEFTGRIINVPVKSVNFLPHNMSATRAVEMNEMTADSLLSIEDCLSFFSEEAVNWQCDNKCIEETQMVRSSDKDTTFFGDQTEQSDRTTSLNEQSSEPSRVECKSSHRQPQASDAQSQIIQTLDRITEGTSSGLSYEKELVACSITNKEPKFDEGILPTEKQTDLLRSTHSEDASKQLQMYRDTMKQLEPFSSACQLKDGKNEQKHKDGDANAIQTHLFNKLPPVLTLHFKRAGTDNNFQLKNCEHVRFKEYLDVGRFMDPSYVDKDNSLYRLAGVVEHRGTDSLTTGHYVAYVRAKRLGIQQQQSSCSSSWFCANDSFISQVTLEEVLKREAYILFYERVEGQDMPGIGSHN